MFQAWNWNKVHSNVSQTMASQAKGQRQIWGQVPGTALALDLASDQAQPELSTVSTLACYTLNDNCSLTSLFDPVSVAWLCLVHVAWLYMYMLTQLMQLFFI